MRRMVKRFAPVDLSRMRRVNGNSLSASGNPGISVETQACSVEESMAILRELKFLLKSPFATPLAGTATELISMEKGGQVASKRKVEAGTRVTGRPESATMRAAPWGYGDTCQVTALPPAIRRFVEKLTSSGRYDLGPIRDVTINRRVGGFFQLDPHLDPTEDGPNVFTLNLLSDVVLSFVPCNPSSPRRTDPAEIALKSWTDDDIDVLLKHRDLLHFKDDARYTWMHAIRAGVEVGPPVNQICDWWGDLSYLNRREKERISMVLAFGSAK